MAIFVIGGTGFIGTRVIRLLAARGEEIVCMDINPGAASFEDLGKQVRVMRGDVTQFDDVMAATVSAKPDRIINLSYFLGSEHAPHVAMKLNILGMDNCFEAARLAGVQRVVFASSLAVNGMQKHYGDRMITEDDYRHGEVQYAMHKIFNEWQAQDYNEKYGMAITAIRPANVTGPDKVRGSVDHVNIITQPAQGKAISFPYKDAMRCPIHVDDIAEVFTRVLLTDKPKHSVYNSGGIADQPGRDRRHRARVPARRAHQLRARDRRQGVVGQLPDRQHAPGAGVRRAVPAVSPARAADHQRHSPAGRSARCLRLTVARPVVVLCALLLATSARAQPAVDWSKAQTVNLLMVDDRFVPDHLSFQHGVPYRFTWRTTARTCTSSPRRSSLPMPSCAIRACWRMAARRSVVQPGAEVDVYLVPMKAGTFRLICADHDWDGMVGEITVE